MKPIQDEVYNAVKEISEDKGYQIVWDRASAMSIIFASPKIDISNEVLIKLGYSKKCLHLCALCMKSVKA